MTQTDIDKGRLIVPGRRRAGEARRVRHRAHRPVDRARRRLTRRRPLRGSMRRTTMANDKRNDPFRAFNFSVEIDGIPSGALREVERPDRRGRRGRLPRRHGPAAATCASLSGLRKYSQHHAEARLHQGQHAVAVVQQHPQRPARPAQRHDRADERGARAGDALARRERLDQQDRRAQRSRPAATRWRWSRSNWSTKG